MKNLTKKIGETYISADLTTLLSFKAAYDRYKKTYREELVLSKEESEKSEKSEISGDFQQLRKNPLYKIKCYVLEILGVQSSDFLKFTRNPLNLFYEELITSQRTPNGNDERVRKLIFPILLNLSEQVEIDHRLRWERKTKMMPPAVIGNFRKKNDIMLWRLRSRLLYAFETEDWKEVTFHLKLLGDYIENCQTRVMCTQVADVCLGMLIKLKKFLFSKHYPDSRNLEFVELTNSLIRVFDILAEKNLFGPLNDMLLTILVHKQEAFLWIEGYASTIYVTENLITFYQIGIFCLIWIFELPVIGNIS